MFRIYSIVIMLLISLHGYSTYESESQNTAFAIPHSEFAIPHSTFRIPHSAFAIPNSEFRIPHSAFAIPHSEFATPHSAFAIPNSEFRIPHSAFAIPNSEFRIPNSEFATPHSEFRIPHSEFRIPNSEFATPHSEFRIPNSEFATPHSPKIIKADFRDWTKEDLLTMSAPNNEYILNDGFDSSRDIIAFYFRQTEKTLYFRVDFFDLKINAENGYLDFYILINFTSNIGSQIWLPDYTDTKTDSPWSIAIAVYDTLNYNIYTPDWNTTFTSAMEAIAFHGEYDSVEFAVNSRILTDNGYRNNETLKFQVATTKDFFENVGKSDLLDTIPQSFPWDSGYLNGTILSTNRSGTAKLSFVHHGNQFIKNIDDFIEDKNKLGFINVPRIHEKWNVPVNLHLSGTLVEGIQWYKPSFNDYLRELVKKGIVDMLGGYYSEYIPKYAPEELNNWSLKYGLQLAKEFYGDNYVPCAWLPERVFWENYDESIKNNGYECVIADTEDAFKWYAEPQFTNEHKVYTSPKGLKIFFISNRGNNTPPENRYNIQEAIFQLTDEGLNINLREKFIYYALDNDREQYWLYMDDWEKVTGNIPDWGGPEVVYFYERTIAWLANHPWIEVVTLDKMVNFSTAGTINIKDATYFWLSGSVSRWKGDALAGFGSLGNYDAWYYDPRKELTKGKSYFEYIPADTNMKLGDYKTPETLIYKTWSLIKNIKNESLKELAFKTFANGFYETAWRDFLRMDHDISYWQKEQAAHIRYANYYYYADQWLNSPFVTRNSSFVTRNSSFVTRNSSLVTRNSSLVTRSWSSLTRQILLSITSSPRQRSSG